MSSSSRIFQFRFKCGDSSPSLSYAVYASTLLFVSWRVVNVVISSVQVSPWFTSSTPGAFLPSKVVGGLLPLLWCYQLFNALRWHYLDLEYVPSFKCKTYQPKTFCSRLGFSRSIFRLSWSRHWIWFRRDIHQYCKPSCFCVILFMLIWVMIFEVVVSWKCCCRHNHCNNSPISSAKYCSPFFPLTLMVHFIPKAPSTDTVSNKDGKSHECYNWHWDDHCNCSKHRAVAFPAASKYFGTFCHVRDIGCITSLADYCTTVRFYALPKLWDIYTYASLAYVPNYSMIGTQIVWCRLSMVVEMASTKTALGWMYGLNGAWILMATHTRRKRW